MAPAGAGVPLLSAAAPGAFGWFDEDPAVALASADCVVPTVAAGFGCAGVLTPPQALTLSNKATAAAVLM